MSSRNALDLEPKTRDLFYKFRQKCMEAGISFTLTCTYRPQEEQDALYTSGRSRPGPIKTKAKYSKHTMRQAFDIAIIKNGKIVWNIEDYKEAGKIGMALGLRWGGDFDMDGKIYEPGFIDAPHFEYYQHDNTHERKT